MQDGNGFRIEIGEVRVDQCLVGDQIGTIERAFESFGSGGLVECAVVNGVMDRLLDFRLLTLVRRTYRPCPAELSQDVSPAIEKETVPAILGVSFHQVDTAIHQRNHGVAWSGPPIAIAFRRLITGQRAEGQDQR